MVRHLTLEMQRMPLVLPSGSPARRRRGAPGSPRCPETPRDARPAWERPRAWAAADAAPSEVPPPPGWAGPAPAALPPPGRPPGLAGPRAAPSTPAAPAAGGEPSQQLAAAASAVPPSARSAPAGIMGGPAARAPGEAGRGRAGRAGRDRPARTQEEGQWPSGAGKGGKRRNENKNTLEGRCAPPLRLGGSWRQEDGPRCPFFPRLPPPAPLPLQRCRGCSQGLGSLSRCQPGSSVFLVSFAGGNKGW